MGLDLILPACAHRTESHSVDFKPSFNITEFQIFSVCALW